MKISPRFGPREPRFGRDLKSRFGVSRREILAYVNALLTADGSDDHLIKLEGVPAGYTLII